MVKNKQKDRFLSSLLIIFKKKIPHLQFKLDETFSHLDKVQYSNDHTIAHYPIYLHGIFLGIFQIKNKKQGHLELDLNYLNELIQQHGSGLSEKEDFNSHKDERAYILSEDLFFLDFMKILEKVALEEVNFFLVGEKGTGKSFLARHVHFISPRKNMPLEILSGSNPLFEEIFFGDKNRQSLLEKANYGTIVITDTENIPLEIQKKLAQLGEFPRIFSPTKNDYISCSIRFIFTTTKIDFSKFFDEDFIFYFKTFALKIPSLKERKSDIKLLAHFFLNENRSKNEKKTLTDSSLKVLEDYSWPGNINELKNMMKEISLFLKDQFITIEHLDKFKNKIEKDNALLGFKPKSLWEIEKDVILKTLKYFNGNKSHAAKILGITIKTLYNKLQEYGKEYLTDENEDFDKLKS